MEELEEGEESQGKHDATPLFCSQKTFLSTLYMVVVKKGMASFLLPHSSKPLAASPLFHCHFPALPAAKAGVGVGKEVGGEARSTAQGSVQTSNISGINTRSKDPGSMTPIGF